MHVLFRGLHGVLFRAPLWYLEVCPGRAGKWGMIFPTDRAGTWGVIFPTGRAGTWEVIFPTGLAGPAKRELRFLTAEFGYKRRKTKILRVSLGWQNKDEILKPTDKRNTFIICKQLNGPVLTKSLKSSCLDRNRKKNWPGQARAKILYFGSGQAGLGPKFQFPFSLLRTGPGWNCSHAGRVGPGLKNPARADL